MKRLIINLTMAAATFSVSAATHLLPAPNHQLSASGPPATPPASVSNQIATLSNYSTSPPELGCDYDPKEFNPRGDYFILGPKPKHFREFDCLELAIDRERAAGVADVQTYWRGVYGGPYLVSGSVTKRRLALVAVPISEEDFEYRFEGTFLRDGVLSNARKNEAVLKGYLTKLKRGVKIAECEVRFRIEYLGC